MRLSLFKILLFSVIRFQVHMSWKNWRDVVSHWCSSKI